MSRTQLSVDDSAIVLIDHAVGFANLIGSHTPEENIHGAVALAEIAKVFQIPLVVTGAPDDTPAGPLYPQLQEVLGDHPVIVRDDLGFDSFDNADFAAAIEATGRRQLVMAGVLTDMCLMLTALTAIERGYEVHVVVDASASTTKETHDTAVLRLVQAGAIPNNWFAVGSELQRSWTKLDTAPGLASVIDEHIATWRQLHAYTANIAKVAKVAANAGQ